MFLQRLIPAVYSEEWEKIGIKLPYQGEMAEIRNRVIVCWSEQWGRLSIKERIANPAIRTGSSSSGCRWYTAPREVSPQMPSLHPTPAPIVCKLCSLPPTWSSPHRGTYPYQGPKLLQKHHWWRRKLASIRVHSWHCHPTVGYEGWWIIQLGINGEKTSANIQPTQRVLTFRKYPKQETVEEDLTWGSMEPLGKGI